MWLNVLQTIVWLPFKSHAQSSFDKNVLLSNPYSKMVGFCFGLAIPTLDWYTTLVMGGFFAAAAGKLNHQALVPDQATPKNTGAGVE